VIQRGLEKKAPFHRERNSVADALLIELVTVQDRREPAAWVAFERLAKHDMGTSDGLGA